MQVSLAKTQLINSGAVSCETERFLHRHNLDPQFAKQLTSATVKVLSTMKTKLTHSVCLVILQVSNV